MNPPTLPPCYRCHRQPCQCADGVTLYCADCRELLPHLPADLATLVLADPPYSSGGMVRGDRTNKTTRSKYQRTGTLAHYPDFTGDNRDQRGFLAWYSLTLAACRRVSRPSGFVASFSDWRQLPTVTDAIQSAGYVWRGIAVWDKTAGVRPILGRPSAQCEFIAWGTNGAHKPAGDAIPGLHRQPAPRHRRHQTQKPTQVLAWLTRLAPQSDAVILDPFAGSGTTGLAAIDTGHRAILIEIDPAYCEIAASRLMQKSFPSFSPSQPLS